MLIQCLDFDQNRMKGSFFTPKSKRMLFAKVKSIYPRIQYLNSDREIGSGNKKTYN